MPVRIRQNLDQAVALALNIPMSREAFIAAATEAYELGHWYATEEAPAEFPAFNAMLAQQVTT